MSEEERDSCQLTELSAIERANVESDDKVAPFSLFLFARTAHALCNVQLHSRMPVESPIV